jgi:hypothetical protein
MTSEEEKKIKATWNFVGRTMGYFDQVRENHCRESSYHLKSALKLKDSDIKQVLKKLEKIGSEGDKDYNAVYNRALSDVNKELFK